jgi:diguanylate cyclase (GGDEF)-like protein
LLVSDNPAAHDGSNDGERIDELNRRARLLLNSDVSAGLEAARSALALAEAAGDRPRVAEASHNLGVMNCLLFQYADALSALHRAYEIYMQLDDTAGRAAALNWIGNVEWRRSDYGAALKAQLTALHLHRELSDPQGKADVLNSLGNIYFHVSEYDRALDAYQRSLQLREQIRDRDGESETLNNIGNIYGELADHNAALQHHERALQLKRQLGFARSEALALANVGTSCAHLGDITRARDCYKEALALATKSGQKMVAATVLQEMGTLQLQVGEAASALEWLEQSRDLARADGNRYAEAQALLSRGEALIELGELDRARDELQTALDTAESIGARRFVRNAYRALSTVAEQMDDHALALRNFRRFHEVDDEIYSAEQNRRVQSVLVQAQVERSQRDADLLRQANNELTAMNDELVRANTEKAELLERLSLQTAELERQTREDSLTGIYNRRHLDAELATEVERARRFQRELAVVMADIDYFKKVNDNFSHAIGDAVLREVADILKNGVRSIDIVARYGGEEFSLLLLETSAVRAIQLCERLRTAIEEHDWSRIADGLRITMSFGIAAASAGLSPAEVLGRADANLYHAKVMGRNRVVCG